MSRGPGGAVLAPADEAVQEPPGDFDARLVAAVRHGDDRAFEALYQRYQRRIHAYVMGMVKDHGRAEDVTQEVFVSALRRMRATDRPIAFKPWIYEIAKNACIDAFRRSRRAEEISYDADEGLAPADHLRLVGSGPTPDAAVAAKHELETLCGAFGGLSESHHQILVLRELEGLTYEQIGERMGMTRPAVESTLFRARRRLTEEYDDLVSGARCLRVQAIIAGAATGAVGLRDSRRLSRHLAHCQPCRREALAAGLDRGLLVRRPARKRIAEKIAGLLPFPGFLRLRRGGDVPSPEPPGARLAAHLPALSDQLSGPWAKAAAGAALLLAGVGTGVGVQHVASAPAQVGARPAAAKPVAHKPQSSPAAVTAASRASVTARYASSRSGGARGDDSRRSADRAGGSGNSGSAADRATSVGGGAPASTPAASRGASGASGDAASGGGGGAAKPHLPSTAGLPATTSDPVKQVTTAGDQTSGAVNVTAKDAPGAVQGAVRQATGTVDGAVRQATGTVQQVAGDGPASGTVQGVTGAVDGAAGTVKRTVDDTAGAATGKVGQVTGGLLGGG